MAREPASDPVSWDRLSPCGECGKPIRPRPNDEKRCSRCKEVTHISAFGHTTWRADHRDSYCRECKRAMQNEANRSRRSRGKPEPISALGPVGEETRAIVGRYVSQGDLSAWVRRADRESVFVNYETIEREPVYQLTLRRGRQNEVRIPHAFRQVADASLKKGQWIAVVIQDGELAKVVVEGDKYPLVDTSLDFTEDPTSPIGARFGSYSPARPWSLGLAVEFLLDEKPKPTGQGCLLCGNEQGVVEDFTLRCPNCTNDLRYSAELLLADLVEPEIAFAVLSRLETDWLLNQIPKRVEVPA